MKILFVCTGNTCRSPMAEKIFAGLCQKNGRADVVVKSAGTHAYPPHTRWCDEMLSEFDHIVCMEQGHADFVQAGGAPKNIHIFNIKDPWGQSQDVYSDVHKKLQKAIKVLYNEICKTLL